MWTSVATAQFNYSQVLDVPVMVEGEFLTNPWAGGLNSAQINTIDLNADQKQDLVVYDRAVGRLLTFLNESNKYVYAPEYEYLFPKEISQWVLFRDYNCDGKKDIFTSDPFGIIVFVNITTPGGQLKWRKFNPGFPLLTKGFSSNINLKVNETDIPAIDDIDGDGDLDILNAKFVGNNTVEFHKNFSMERTGTCDSLQFERITQNYGDFEDCDCGKFAFGMTCVQLGGGRTNHAGGKTLLSLDLDNDGDKELLYSEESCAWIYLLENIGTPDNAILRIGSRFPPNFPINFLFFPGAFYEDVNFDNKPDLLASPNLYSRTFLNNSFEESVWLYINTGTAQSPSFTFSSSNFLQNTMIEKGDYSRPFFYDDDDDGDLDMFISHYGGDDFITTISHYRNTGTPWQPEFVLVDEDYLFFSLSSYYNIRPQFADIDGNGTTDLVFTSTDFQQGITKLRYIANQSTTHLDFGSRQIISTNVTIGFNENFFLIDVNQDGDLDMLRGRFTGALEYWENSTAGGFDFALEDNAYLNLGTSSSRSNLAIHAGDLDADGRLDLVLGDHRGNVLVYPDFRSSAIVEIKDLIFNPVNESYEQKNLGGRIQPHIVNLFNTDYPAMAVGNATGGIILLKNDGGQELPAEPQILIYPNPLPQGEALNLKSDRNAVMQIYSLMGQKISEPVEITANVNYSMIIEDFAAGLYIASFIANGKSYGRKFIVHER